MLPAVAEVMLTILLRRTVCHGVVLDTQIVDESNGRVPSPSYGRRCNDFADRGLKHHDIYPALRELRTPRRDGGALVVGLHHPAS